MIVDTSALIAILRDAPNSYRTASSVTSQNLPAERSGPAREDCNNSNIQP
jgi:uncharacterized protein with PIN domain